MKKLISLLVALLCFATASLDAKDVRVKGYTRKDGTYVAPHTRSSPNKTKNDNYSTRGNVNPYTGKEGTKPRDAETKAITTAPVKADTPATDGVAESKITGWLAVKSGMSESELRRQFGQAKDVERKADFEIWTYSTGTVFVKEGRVVAWKQEKIR